MTTVSLDLHANVGNGVRFLAIRSDDSAVSSDTARLAKNVPQMIPEDQLLFWTPEWQEVLDEVLPILPKERQSTSPTSGIWLCGY